MLIKAELIGGGGGALPPPTPLKKKNAATSNARAATPIIAYSASLREDTSPHETILLAKSKLER
ncbi:MAG: hypothetical protein NUV59_02045 [Patescibacteria group bacterium]|nr:hypothetical protein [Patescibacteria group bacterium]